MSDASQPWHADGLCFSCTGCGHCCRIEGFVWVRSADIKALARHLGLSLHDFGRRYLRRAGLKLALVDKPNGDCVFWQDGCTVYEARPRQCRTFPFWPPLLESPEAWAQTASECEGIGQGRRYQLQEIEALLRGEAEATNPPPDEKA